ncbi:MAG: hypothetical protein AB7F29_13895 [Candidatus Nitrosocosmicus sp.]
MGYVRAEVEDKAVDLPGGLLGESGSEEAVSVKRKKRVAKPIKKCDEN